MSKQATKTEKGDSKVLTKDWEKWLKEQPEEGEPEKRCIHVMCAMCYPEGFAGSSTALCGVVVGPGKPAKLYRGPSVDHCESCARTYHRAPNAPCPNWDCPRRTWVGRIWKRLTG